MHNVHPNRRNFIGRISISIAAARLGLLGMASAAAANKPASGSFPEKLKQINAGLLNIGYVEAGPAGGPVVILLHGWPYDIHSYTEVTPLLVSKGYRVIVPYLRGFGTTRFLSEKTMRNGQQSAIAADIPALMDALGIKKASIAGFDWGARTAVIMAALWPERCKAIVSVSGYIIVNLKDNIQPLPPKAELAWWYQYYFATERGRLGYGENRKEFNRLIWKIASPEWKFNDATFGKTARAFDNPDHVDIVIHNYRWRLSVAEGEPKYDHLEEKLFAEPAITVPTITIGSDFDGAAADGASYAKKFIGKYSHRVFVGIGHNVPQEAPVAFAKAIIESDAL
jgi:pimeloyl-ACP methyl ester carboxylesterase